MPTPRISVIVAVTHRDVVASSLAALARQTLPHSEYEVIVVDSLKVEEWRERLGALVAGSAPTLQFSYYDATGGRAAANNVAIRHAKADVLLITADDFLLHPGSVEAHLKFHQQNAAEGAVGVGPGFFAPALRRDAFARWLEDSGDLIGISFTKGNGSIPPDFFYAGNCSVKRALVDRAGMFDEDFPSDAWDDYELGLRLKLHGMHATYLPDAAADHQHLYSIDIRRENLRKAGEAAVIFERKYPGPHEWQAQCRVSPWRYALAGTMARAAYLMTGSARHRDRYYRSILASEFVSAYREAKAARGNP